MNINEFKLIIFIYDTYHIGYIVDKEQYTQLKHCIDKYENISYNNQTFTVYYINMTKHSNFITMSFFLSKTKTINSKKYSINDTVFDLINILVNKYIIYYQSEKCYDKELVPVIINNNKYIFTITGTLFHNSNSNTIDSDSIYNTKYTNHLDYKYYKLKALRYQKNNSIFRPVYINKIITCIDNNEYVIVDINDIDNFTELVDTYDFFDIEFTHLCILGIVKKDIKVCNMLRNDYYNGIK